MQPLPTLRQLQYLVALAEHKHFGRAAEACFVTQSTLSASLQELEGLLGVTLVERSRRRVEITPLGEEVIARAARLLRDASDLVDLARAGRAPLTGPLTLGVIPTIAPYLLPPCMGHIRRHFPLLELHLVESQSADLLEDLAQCKLDVGLLALPYRTDGFVVKKLFAEKLKLACPVDHPWATKEHIRAEELGGVPMVMLADGHCLRDHALEFCPLAGQRGNETFQATSMATLTQMVANGLGVTLIPEMAVARETGGDSGLVALDIKGDDGQARDIALVWREGSARSLDFETLGDAIIDARAARNAA